MESNMETFVGNAIKILGVLEVFALVLALTNTKEDKEVESYLAGQYKDSISIIANTVTDQKNDYFVVDKEGNTEYVSLIGKGGDYTHESTRLTGKTTSLNEMKEDSIKRKNKPSSTHYFPVFLPIR